MICSSAVGRYRYLNASVAHSVHCTVHGLTHDIRTGCGQILKETVQNENDKIIAL